MVVDQSAESQRRRYSTGGKYSLVKENLDVFIEMIHKDREEHLLGTLSPLVVAWVSEEMVQAISTDWRAPQNTSCADRYRCILTILPL